MTIKSDPTPISTTRSETESLLSSNPAHQQDLYQSNDLPHPATTSSYTHSPLSNNYVPTSDLIREISLADKRAMKRVLSAIFWGFIIYIGTSILVGSIVLDEIKWKGHHHIISPQEGRVCNDYSEISLASTSSSTLSKIYSYNPILYYAFSSTSPRIVKMTYPLNLSQEDTLWFNTEGDGAKGDVEFVIMNSEDEKSGKEEGRVEVFVEYYGLGDTGMLICMDEKKLEDSEGYKRGIDIFAPVSRTFPHFYKPTVHVTYYLPSSLTTLNTLLTDSSNFAITSHSPTFPSFSNTISIKNKNAPIMIIGPLIASELISLHSSNARIVTHNVVKSKQVIIQTSNSPIETSEIHSKEFTHILNSNGGIIGNYSIENDLKIRTSNSLIEAKVSLLSIGDNNDENEKEFEVDIQSSNGRIDVVYLNQPKNSYLDSKVVSSNQMVKVSYDPQFEGSYSLSTSNGPLIISGPKTTKDPSGLDRTRILIPRTVSRNLLTGTIGWKEVNEEVVDSRNRGERNPVEGRGTGIVKSSNSRVEVVFL